MANSRYWIKKSIGLFRDQRIREDDDLEVAYMDDLEDYLIHCIKCYDEEVKSLSKSQSKHKDQSVPQQSASNSVTNEDFMQHEVDKNDIENGDNLVLNEQQVPKHNNGESTSRTEEILSCVDGTNKESPEKRQKVSDEDSNDHNTESDEDINTDTQKKNGSGKNESHVNRQEDEPHLPIADDSQN